MQYRSAHIRRETKETRIVLDLNIDGSGKGQIRTGIPFFDHMLTLFAKHAVVDLKLICKGDLEVDAHHTVEDCGIALGQAYLQGLGDKKGVRRYGFAVEPDAAREDARPPSGSLKAEAYVPMDECLARCVVDFGGRPYLVWRGMKKLAFKHIPGLRKPKDMAMAFRFGLAREFFQAFAN